MQFTRTAAAAIGAATLLAAPAAHAQASDDIAALRRDMETLRQDYEARVAALEQRLAQAEADAAAAQAAAEAAQASPPADQVQTVEAPPPQGGVSAANTNPNIYNPGISVALNGFYSVSRNETGDETIAGFATGDEIGRPGEGFSLGESEISFAANIDPSLAGFLALSVDSENQIGVEEAYVRTTALPYGFTLKLGRFLSGVGYLNERHAHDWSFSDAPLPYRAFLNTQLGDDGVQVRWIAPTDFYLEFGAEALRGDGYPAANSDNGAGTYAGFVRTGGDLGVSSSYLAGLSYLHASATDREDAAGDLFTGDTDLGILTLIYKWAPGGNPIVRNLTLAGEYFWGSDDGEFNGLPLQQDHTGWYVQGVYQFMPRWSAGLRYSAVDSDNPGAAFAGTPLDEAGVNPFEITGLLEYDTSEFGRFRVQYSRDESGADANDIMLLQYTVIYGPHGAHRY
ncbi:hypothetical protein [Terricaulis sp.]|uniref:hypothetical protein n=1 Tax=Terricaulis sp. TaxID=2768686 RepID=UPI00378348E9